MLSGVPIICVPRASHQASLLGTQTLHRVQCRARPLGKQSEMESLPRLASDPGGDSRAAAALGNPSPQAQPRVRPSASSLIAWLSYLWLLFQQIKEKKMTCVLKGSPDPEEASLRS